ncbi:MAG TPA: hypothetical protein VF758_00310 [Candidatus Acidoferrum sp.]
MSSDNPVKLPKQILRFLVLDVSAVLVLTLLVRRGAISLYPLAALAVLILFIFNVLLASKFKGRLSDNSAKNGSVPLSMWFVASVFTVAGVAALVSFVVNPSMPHGVQACVAILLVGYIWYVVYHLGRGRNSQRTK